MLRLFSARSAMLATAASAGVALVAMNLPASATSKGSIHRDTTGTFSDTVSGGAVLNGVNNDGSNPFNDYGIEGKVPNDTGGVALLGYGQAAKSYGVYGVTFGANGIGVYGAGDGPAPASGATPSSTQQSTGVVGDSKSGVGVFGSTEFPNDSLPLGDVSVAAGVEGTDVSGKGHNAGVVGNTATGYAGVVGNATGSTANNDSYGVAGASNNTDDNSAGVYGTGANYGTFGIGKVAGAVGVSTGRSGVVGLSSYTYATDGGFGTFANAGGAFAGNYVGVFGESPNPTSPGIDTYGLALVNETSGNYTFLVDYEGDSYQTGTASADEVTRNPQQRVRAFVPTATRATTEDFGEGRIVNGQTFVHLDPTFAQSIENEPYMVFVTPEGDTKGLYVTGKSMSGFSVRETQGGRSTLSFSYRIVATQYGRSDKRLSLVTVGRSRTLADIRAASTRALARPVSYNKTMSKPAANASVENRRF